MDINSICLGCMSNKGSADHCQKCGYVPDQNRNSLALPYKTILNKKFLIGRILGKPGGFGVTYLAWDMMLQTIAAIK